MEDFETWTWVNRVLGCGTTLLALAVAIAGAVAAARIKTSKGAWVAVVALFGLAIVAAIGDVLDFATESFGSSTWFWLGWSVVDLLCLVVLAVGLALIGPPPSVEPRS